MKNTEGYLDGNMLLWEETREEEGLERNSCQYSELLLNCFGRFFSLEYFCFLQNP